MEKDLTINNTITYDCKVEKITGEVDFELYNDVLGKKEVDRIYEEEDGVNRIYNGKDFQNSPIKIETLKQILLELEKNGCNYVSIDYHCDHIEYEVYGVDVHVATEEEIVEYENKERSKMLKQTSELRKAAKEYLEKAEEIEKNLK